MPYATDGLVGKLALQRGLISAGQLKDALAEQAAILKSGQKRPLGVIMVSRGWMQDEQLLELLEEQKRVLAERSNFAQVRKDDFLFGQILLKQGVAGSDEINRALRVQAEAAERGEIPVPRLGQILIDHGVTEEKTIQATLKIQYKTLYECPGCTLKYNLVEASGDKQYRCKKCGALLAPKPPGSGVKADESAYGMKLEVASDLPPEVAEAELDPVNEFGKYTLVRQLGRGGSGTVHLAYQKELKRFVALKLLRGDDEETAQRFAHEAQLAARLRHPHIVSVYEIGTHLTVPFLALEYVDGRSLDQRGRLPLRKACQILRDVANAVHYAHDKGVLHRDLKPQNILLDQDDRPFVTDFGLAREISSARNLTIEGVVVGTPAYMSPEQAQGERTLDGRSDVASLGAVFYELLTGVQPYDGATQIDIALAVINKDPLPPRRRNAQVPLPLEAVCLKAMAKQREDRYPTALALAEDLQRYLEGEAVLAQMPGVVQVAVRRLSRNKTATLIGAAAILGLIVAVAAVSLVLRDSSAKSELLEARRFEDDGRLEDALRRFERHPAAAADAQRVRAALRRRDARELLSRAGPGTPPAERAAVATRAIELAPDDAPAYLARATARLELGADAEAYEDLGRVAELSPTPLPSVMTRIEIARRRGRPEDELADLGKALDLNPLSVEFRLQRASAAIGLAAGAARGRSEELLRLAEADLAAVRSHPGLEALQTRLREARATLR